MGILDEAIKEHLELKRQHGAGDDELKKLEDEAFGAAERPGEADSAPDPFAEAPTAFMAQPDLAEPGDDEEPPAEEEAPAIEQAIPSGPSTEERETIAEQPTEMYDLDEELGGSEVPAPSEDELVEEEMQEPRLAPVDPLSGVDDEEDEDEGEEDGDDDEEGSDDFFDEKRLSDELDQALEDPDELEEDEEPPAEEDEEEDVLEETPDFLEEAPEDDRLWFEQKPPKDFDFED
jgi:hypothetical protein